MQGCGVASVGAETNLYVVEEVRKFHLYIQFVPAWLITSVGDFSLRVQVVASHFFLLHVHFARDIFKPESSDVFEYSKPDRGWAKLTRGCGI